MRLMKPTGGANEGRCHQLAPKVWVMSATAGTGGLYLIHTVAFSPVAGKTQLARTVSTVSTVAQDTSLKRLADPFGSLHRPKATV